MHSLTTAAITTLILALRFTVDVAREHSRLKAVSVDKDAKISSVISLLATEAVG